MRALPPVLAAVTVLGTLLAAPASGAAAAPPCETVGFSPAFATDRTMFCARRADGGSLGFELYRSTDRGRTWQRRARVMPADAGPGNDAVPMAVHVDAAYPTTKTVYVHVGLGLFQAADDGASVVRLATGQLGYPFHLTPYRERVPGAGALERTAFVNGQGNTLAGAAYVFDTVPAGQLPDAAPRLGRVVPGAPLASAFFIVPPDYPDRRAAVVIGKETYLARTPDGRTEVGAGRLAAFACTGDFACPTMIAPFRDQDVLSQAGSLGPLSWLVVTHFDDSAVPKTVHWSPDYGRTWQPWTSVNKLVDQRAARLGAYPSVSVTRAADAPRRLFLRLSYGSSTAAKLPWVPAEQLFRSDDEGATWRRVGYARAVGQPGRDRGTLPYNSAGPDGQAGVLREVVAQPGGRLYVVAGTHTGGTRFSYWGLYCSGDLGRSWRRGGGC